MSIPNISLSSGTKIPGVGFGLWKVDEEVEFRQVIKWALQAGFRHFDTAQAYGNEQWLGAELAAALAAGEVKRDELFVTTKIAVEHFGSKHTLKSFDQSYQKLQLDYVDLVLLHFPVSLLRDKSWHALEEIQASGRAKAIGVSNYTVRHLEHLLQIASVKPAVNQVELHVFLQQPELVEYCRTQDIVVEAYSPLAHGQGLDNQVLTDIAAKYGKTPTQVMLRWCVEQGTVPLPKSVHQDRIAQNIDIFDFAFDADDRVALKALDADMRTCWNPTRVP